MNDDKEILTYELRIADDARAGEYDLDIMYSDPASNSITKTTLTIEVSSDDTAEIIHIDKTVLIPGKETEMTFKIVNNGGSSLHDLTFSFENPDDAILPVGSDNTRHVSFIGAGESQEITYTVVADTTVDPGLYVLDLNLEYEDDYSSSNIQTTTAGVYVGGETSFSVALSETTTNEITLSVANIGSNPAYSVLVSLPSQQGLSVSGASSQIIGNLDNGDYTLASFSVSNNPENLEVIVSYTDTRGERIEVTQDISLGTSQSETATGDSNMPPATADGTTRTAGNRNPMMQMTNPQSNNSGISSLLINTFIVVIIVVGGIVGYRYYKKRKSNKLRPLKRAKR